MAAKLAAKTLLAFVLLVGATMAEEDDVESEAAGPSSGGSIARILAVKRVQNKYLVEGKDLVIKYGLYNVGDSAATDLVLTESGFGTSDFDIVGGSTTFKIGRIGARTNVTQVLVVRPKKFGYYNFTAASFRYKSAGEDDSFSPMIGITSDPGQGFIISLKEYDRQFSPHVLDWLAFAVMTLPSVGIPFLLWNSSRSKYENMKLKD